MNRLESVIVASQTSVRLTHVAQAAQWRRDKPKPYGGRPGVSLKPIKGPVDFFGCVRRTGRMICLDAKMVGLVTRCPIGDSSHFPTHQYAMLDNYGRDGAIAGFLIEATAHNRYFWASWKFFSGPPPASVPWDALLYIGPTTHSIDWRPIIDSSSLT